jgi:hypothetical protein
MTRRTFIVHASDGTAQRLELKGREEWALSHLLTAGDRGCTPIDTPGPRWSDYVFKLRRRGIDVETITEAHGGPYRGTHARYRLVSKVEPMTELGVVSAKHDRLLEAAHV